MKLVYEKATDQKNKTELLNIDIDIKLEERVLIIGL
jgi:hypothetical protein